MLDLGWTEILVVGVVALIVIGPRDLPAALHTFGKYVGKLRSMARDFQHGIDEIARQHELQELQKSVRDIGSPTKAMENYIDRMAEEPARPAASAASDETAPGQIGTGPAPAEAAPAEPERQPEPEPAPIQAEKPAETDTSGTVRSS
jgi:sec-independent protein translocase protein TatB